MDEYVGIPFKNDGRDKDGLDCWGLVRVVYKDKLNIDLPSYEGVFVDTSKDTFNKIGELMATNQNSWEKVENPKPLDVLLIRVNGGVPSHVAVYVGDDWMLHTMEGMDVTMEKTSSIRWNKRIVGAYRYAGNC
jgi:cell wall-associated NlpC family hydrolase